jgi:nitronate monooxygenase
MMGAMSVLGDLGVRLPVLAAPMAGGPTSPALVVAAAEAGSLGFLAAGYQSPESLAAQLAAVRAETELVAVNLFAPHPVPVDPAAYAAYRERLLPLAERYGVELPAQPVENDDAWADKVDGLLAAPPPLVSFTFGLPDPPSATALRGAGSVLAQTVTSAAEARLAAQAGLDLLIVQSSAAGAHSGTFTAARPPADVPLPELVAEVRAAVDLPVIAAGGVAGPADVRAALDAGATAVMVGTALLLASEAGTSAVHRAALTDAAAGEPLVTHAFTGRPARALPNSFLADHDGHAPLGYPALHHLTSPIRRAAAAAGDPGHANLWAGTGYRAARSAPAAQLLTTLAP